MLEVACGFVIMVLRDWKKVDTLNRCRHAARFYRKLAVASLWICWLKWPLLAIVITDTFFQDLHARFVKLCFSSVFVQPPKWSPVQGWGSFRGRDHFGGCTVSGQSFSSIKRDLRNGHEAIACGGDLYRHHYHHHRHHHYPNHHHYYYYYHYYYKYHC